MNLSELLEKIGAISTSIAIHKRDLRNFVKELESEFDFTDVEDAEERIDEIDEEIEALQKKEKRLYKQAKKLLEDVEDATARSV